MYHIYILHYYYVKLHIIVIKWGLFSSDLASVYIHSIPEGSGKHRREAHLTHPCLTCLATPVHPAKLDTYPSGYLT